MCCDEKTGIQALERASATRFPVPGFVERQDAHYIRHGTRTLIANFEVATGHVLSPSIGPTRNEQDFVNHISRTVAVDPEAEWIFIVDNLNIHLSEALVRFVADVCDLQLDMGIKGRRGILRSNATALIWRVLMVAEKRFRRLCAPHLMADVYANVRYENGSPIAQRKKIAA